MRKRFFTVVLLLIIAFFADSARAVDVKRFEILKGMHFYQIAEGAAHLQTNNTFRFSAQVYADLVGDVLGSSVFTPKISRIDLLPDNDGDPFRFRDKFDDQFRFENNFPNGAYQLGVRGLHDGDHTMAFTIGGDVYPPAPVVNNYAAAQDLAYNRYNEISWQPFSGGAATDFIQVQIEDLDGNNVWETPDYGEEGALDGLATRTIIPPGEVVPGIYVATIRSVKVLANSSAAYPGAIGTVGYFTRTEFTIRTKATGLDADIDRLQIWRRHRYEQFADGSITEQTVPWQFESKLDALAPNLVSGVRLTLPGILTNDFVGDITGMEFESTSPPLTNGTVFASTYPNGVYTFDITKTDASVQRAIVNLPAGTFPPAPKLLNLSSLTNHPDGEAITVRWEPWSGGSEPDFIRVELSNEDGKIWDTSNYSSPKHLRPTATEVTIPGTNFLAGHDYTIEVHFNHVNVSDTQAIPGALVFGGFDTRTKFDFNTTLADVVTFRVAEGQYFWQRGMGVFEPDLVGPYRFEAQAVAATSNSLHAVQLTTPKGESRQLTPDATNKVFQFAAPAGDAASLFSQYPAGVYTMRFDTASDGLRTSTATMPPLELPPLPLIQNFTNVWRISPAADFSIRWAPWQNVNTNTDKIVFSVERLSGAPIFSTSDSGSKHSLLPTSTNVIIFAEHGDTPAELASNQSYIARLRFERRIKAESRTYPGARGTGAVFSEIAFYISTLTPTFTNNFKGRIALTNGLVQINVPTPLQIGRPYTLFQTHDFTNWTIAKTEALTVPFMRIEPPDQPTFYKAAILP